VTAAHRKTQESDMPRIQANRDTIDDRFSVLGFTVRTESPLFEVAVATDPNLFKPEHRSRRARANFYSSRAHGVTRARRGEAVYLLPPDVLVNFVGQPRLYFGLATYRENTRGAPDFVQAPSDGSMYVGIGQLTERGLRRSAVAPVGSSYGQNNGRDASLDWGGDFTPEPAATTAPAAAARTATATSPAAAVAPAVAVAAGYDDGFGVFPEEPPMAGALDLVRAYNGGLLEQLRFLAESAQWFAGVPNTRGFPHSAICQVFDPTRGAEAEQGTAFYIGRNLLLTAAHVVAGKNSLIFVPGKNGQGVDSTHEPFGRVTVPSTNWRAHERFAPPSRDFDFAIVRTTLAAPGGRWFNLLEELRESRAEGVAVCGYSVHSRHSDFVGRLVSGTIDSRRQHLHGGHVRTVENETFTYDIQTLPGNSGSPVYWIEAGALPRVHMVGVHVAGADDVTNKGCRLTDAKIAWIRARAAEWGQASAMEVDDSVLDQALAIPLDPGAGGRSIGLNALHAGDIIVSTTRAFASRIIRVGTISPVSHTMLYVGDGRVIEAVGSGVREITLAAAIDDAILAVAYRHPQLDATRAAAVVAHARSRVGNPYNVAGVAFQGYRILNPLPAAVISVIGRRLGVEVGQAGAVYCSELVLECFERASLPLTAGTRAAQSTPDQVVQIARSSLSYVGHLKAEDVPLGIQLGMDDAADLRTTSTALTVPTPPRVRVRDRTRRPARFPHVRALSTAERAVVSGAIAVLNPGLSLFLTGLQALARSHNVSVAVGPAAGVGFLIGMGVGGGLIFSSGQWGVYGQFELRGGLIDSASVELQVTIVQGGIESFSGINFAIGVEFDAAVSVSGQALFNTSAQFQGITVGLGVGLGVEPFQLFVSMQAGASQALALSVPDDDSSALALAQAPSMSGAPASDGNVALLSPPPALIQQPLEVEPMAEAQAAPVIIPIAAAVTGAVFTRLLSNSGDVSWELDQMSGLKHPNDQAPNPMPAFQDAPPISLTDWPSSGGAADSISAGFEVRWQYNGKSLGNVQVSNVTVNDAVGWGLQVKARIMNDSIVYPRETPQFAALRVRLEYRFTRGIGADQLAYRELHLFGNGRYNLTGDWTQNTRL